MAVIGTMSPGPGPAELRATRAVSRRRKFSYASSKAVRSSVTPVGLEARTICPCASTHMLPANPSLRCSRRNARTVSKCTATHAMEVES